MKLDIEAKKDNFDKVLEFAEGAMIESNVPANIINSINICLEEIYVNIASYAYSTGIGDGMVHIDMTIDKDPCKVSLRFEDSGIPYNPLEKEDPDISLSAEERKIGGLGVFMVKKMMDFVSYEYKDGKNILTIKKGE